MKSDRSVAGDDFGLVHACVLHESRTASHVTGTKGPDADGMQIGIVWWAILVR